MQDRQVTQLLESVFKETSFAVSDTITTGDGQIHPIEMKYESKSIKSIVKYNYVEKSITLEIFNKLKAHVVTNSSVDDDVVDSYIVYPSLYEAKLNVDLFNSSEVEEKLKEIIHFTVVLLGRVS